MKKFIFLFCVSLFLSSSAKPVEIQLDKMQKADEKSAVVVGYVDIYSLFEDHPMTSKFKDDFLVESEKKKQIIREMQDNALFFESVILSSSTEIRLLQQEIGNIKKTQAQFLQSGATETVKIKVSEGDIKNKEMLLGEKEKELEKLKAELEKKKREIIDLRMKHKEELQKLEAKQTEIVMADIYLEVEEVAKEEGVSVVLDKNNVLYGKSAKNLTDKVRLRLEGK